MDSSTVTKLYENRFSNKEYISKNKIWKILCSNFFSKYIPENSTVLDIGGGYCEFINNINAKKKIIIDRNTRIREYVSKDVIFINTSCFKIDRINLPLVDVVFISNLLEHLNNKEDIISLLKKIEQILKKDGKLLILGPNIKYLYREYWDFFDHKLPLSHLALIEILKALDFRIKKVYRKFLPYTIKNRYPKLEFIIKLYLKCPILYYVFGKQFFIYAEKANTNETKKSNN